jgi:hydrogenase-4 membrane subunit HyfE
MPASPDTMAALKSFLDLLEVFLVVTTMWITISDTVKQVVFVYRLQSLVLAVVTALAAGIKLAERPSAGDVSNVVLILLIAFLPLFLFAFIKPLLVRATLSKTDPSVSEELRMLLAGVVGQFTPIFDRWRRFRIRHEKYRNQERDAETAWIGRKVESSSQRVLLVLPALLLVAFLVPFMITTPGFSSSEKIGLAVSLALHLLGLYNMTLPQRDIISQVIGLLVMDHGLYLAVVKIVEIPVPAAFFVISLYFYTAITMFILIILLPELRRQTGSIERAIIAEKSLLKDV